MERKTQWIAFITCLVVMAVMAISCSSDDMGNSSDSGNTTDGDTTTDGDYAVDGDAVDGDYTVDGDIDHNYYPTDGDTVVDGDYEYGSVDGDSNSESSSPWEDGDIDDGNLTDGDTVDGDFSEADLAETDENAESSDENAESSDEEIDPMANCPDEEDPYIMYLSSDDSNSVASPVITRSYINSGHLPQRQFIRIWEFLNYYHVDYPTPANEEDVEVFADMMSSAEDGIYTLQVAARSFDMGSRVARNSNITFILDTSGSMSGSPINYLRAVCRSIAGKLKAGDIVSMVTWNTGQDTVLNGHLVTGPNDETLLNTINNTTANGSTNLHGGLVNGYRLANENFDPDRLNRVILISDGQANMGVTDADIIGDAANDSDGEGIYLVGVGVGDGVNDTLMERVTDLGRGAYIYINSEDEAQKMFGNRFFENMEIAARALRMEVTLPWYFKMKEFHGEEWSQNPNEVEPQHLAPNDAMVFHQDIIACNNDLVSDDDEIKVSANFANPITRQRTTVEKTYTVGELLGRSLSRQTKGNAIVEYVKVLESISEQPRPEVKENVQSLMNKFNILFSETGDDDYAELSQTLMKLSTIL